MEVAIIRKPARTRIRAERPGGRRCRATPARLPQTVVVKAVVAGERDEAAPRRRQREEDLDGSVLPHARLLQLRPVGPQDVELDALGVSIEQQAAHEQDDEHHVGEERREVDNLPARAPSHTTATIVY